MFSVLVGIMIVFFSMFEYGVFPFAQMVKSDYPANLSLGRLCLHMDSLETGKETKSSGGVRYKSQIIILIHMGFYFLASSHFNRKIRKNTKGISWKRRVNLLNLGQEIFHVRSIILQTVLNIGVSMYFENYHPVNGPILNFQIWLSWRIFVFLLFSVVFPTWFFIDTRENFPDLALEGKRFPGQEIPKLYPPQPRRDFTAENLLWIPKADLSARALFLKTENDKMLRKKKMKRWLNMPKRKTVRIRQKKQEKEPSNELPILTQIKTLVEKKTKISKSKLVGARSNLSIKKNKISFDNETLSVTTIDKNQKRKVSNQDLQIKARNNQILPLHSNPSLF
ncbi:uncharacterized protein LOC111710391 [Eurytemora carolleeae]|uniref:uncharacterized protein LOC111710391 n=1 Tax=Eurytemora carolleeae TaxID=1294199 RepID=UPI000C75E0BD|nr:uncharacterized protein LOC111710391 [Eurytemora carolleeae]|eukprot:XP_023340240.1 uncharacterized protein LOC111710391 [Eurytemora affinis]